MTKQIKDSWAPFSMCVHCVVHHTNLGMQSLGDLTLIAKIEGFMLNMYGYFNHSPKRHEIPKTCSNPRNKREQNPRECQNKMDVHA